MAGPDLTPPNRERAFNAPLGALAFSVAILGLHAVQVVIGADWPERFGLVPQQVWNGEPWRLITVLFVHLSWTHAVMNAVAALAFGSALARRLGESWIGRLNYIAYALVIGGLTSVVEAGLDPTSPTVGVGASGAVFGLVGAMIRLVAAPEGAVAPLHSSQVVTMTAVFAGITVLFSLLFGGQTVGWQAHLIGLGLGLFLIEYWPGVRGARPVIEPEPAPRDSRGPWG